MQKSNAWIYQLFTNQVRYKNLRSVLKIITITTTFLTSTNAFAAPATPVTVTATANTTSVTLTWTGSTGATRYDMVKNGTVSNVGNVTTFIDTAVTSGSSYGYGIRACDATGCSDWKNTSATVPIVGAPQAPSTITTSINNNIIKINWAISAGATSYVLERNNSVITSGSVTSFDDTTGVIGTSYTYRVKACNGNLCSDWKTSLAIKLPPPQPSPITTIISSSTITLNWPWSTGATSFKVVKNGTVTVTNTNSFTWSNVTPGTYGVGVTACIETSCSSWNNLAVTVPATQPIPNVVDSERSLFIRDQATLNAADFSLNSVLAQLATQLNASNPSETVTSTKLFTRFWDTQNLAPGFIAGGPKCTNSLNGFPYECRAAEGVQAQDSTFLNSYIPIALVNRFDLRDKVNFNDCGEYRIVYAMTGRSGRNFIIFEAQVPNPTPGSAAGCSPIVSFWANLSTETNATTRAVALRNFYFNGIPTKNVRAVIDTRNFSQTTGQIRTNQFMGSSWLLREFKVAVEGGTSIIKPVTVKANPFGPLFDNRRTDALAVNFRNQFLNNMNSLLISDLSTFSLIVQSDTHNNGQSHASGSLTSENNFTQHTNLGNGDFKNAIQARAAQLGSNLTADQVINRAEAMTCGGCHEPSAFGLTSPNSVGSNQVWPGTLGFVHVSESINNGKFNISPALQTVFIPARKNDFEAFINTLNTSAASTAKASTSTSLQKTTSPTITGKRSG